jgi:hypothetical protein
VRRSSGSWLVVVRIAEAEVLISSEPKLGKSWLSYLALAPVSVIDDLFDR